MICPTCQAPVDVDHLAEHLTVAHPESGVFVLQDISYCATCDAQRPGSWEGDPLTVMEFRCSACEQVTA